VKNRSQCVAVVGAGIAGLAAARKLQDQGYDVQVFDKGRGVGGRTSVRRQPPFEFDHGAQYFTARDKQFVPHVRAWCEAGLVAPWPGRIGSWNDGVWRDGSQQTRYVGVPGMNTIAKHLATGFNVATGVRVTQLRREVSKWCVLEESGEAAASFDAIVIALPSAQAAELLVGQRELAESARRCSMSPCWAVMLGFDRPLAIPYDGAFIRESPLSWIARNSTKPGRSPSEAWILHASPQWSDAHMDDPPEQVTVALTRAFGRLIASEAPAATFAVAHRWRYAAVPKPLEVGALWDADARVAVCGDWCQGGRIEGAFLSGMAAGGRMSDALIAATGE
jgi:renalase